MIEQKCIICGNIVRFNDGEKFAVCECCETRQEYTGASTPVTPPIYNEPVTMTDSSLKRARKITADTAKAPGPNVPGPNPYASGPAPGPNPYAPGSAPGSNPYAGGPESPMHYAEHDRPAMATAPVPPKRSKGWIVATIVGILVIAIVVAIIILMNNQSENDGENEDEPVTTAIPIEEEIEVIDEADAIIETPLIGMEVSDIVVKSGDPKKYKVSLESLSYEETAYNYVTLEDGDTIDDEREYYFTIKYEPLRGYEFGEETVYSVNGDSDIKIEESETQQVRGYSMMSDDPTTEKVYPTTKFSTDRVDIEHCETNVLELSPMVEDCIEFTTTFQVTSCTSGDPAGNWNVYVRKNDGKFYKVDTFEYSGSGYKFHDTHFDTPTDIDAVIVLPAKNADLEWSYSMDVMGITVKVSE